jgi:Nucleotidyl transferase AbiEii toxin, Type IV TA system
VKRVQNIGASVRQRLLNLSRAENRPFSEVLQYYGMERFLYRLSQSGYRDLFILKGALMLRVWHSPQLRPTMDIDLLGRTDTTPEAVESQIRDILSVETEPDGMLYDPATLTSTPITKDADYPGIRIRFLGSLDTARIILQLDIGFGDIVYPAPEKSEFPFY